MILCAALNLSTSRVWTLSLYKSATFWATLNWQMMVSWSCLRNCCASDANMWMYLVKWEYRFSNSSKSQSFICEVGNMILLILDLRKAFILRWQQNCTFWQTQLLFSSYMYLVRTFNLILLAKYEDRLITILNHTVDSIPNDERNLWLIRVDFFPIECMFSFEIFLVRVFSSSVLYLSTAKRKKMNMNEKMLGFFTENNSRIQSLW